MAYKVLQIITCDTIQVSPEWRIWSLGKGGNQVRVNGCQLSKNASNKDRSNAKVKLFNLLSGHVVEIRNVYKVDGKTVTADVYLNGKNVSEYFYSSKSLPVAEESTSEEAH